MTKNDLITQLKLLALSPEGDKEQDHNLADELLLDYINDPEVTRAFNSIDKWYA